MENIPEPSIKKYDNFFKNQNFEVKQIIFEDKRNFYFKLKNENSHMKDSELELQAYYQAIEQLYNLKDEMKSKNKCLSVKKQKKYQEYTILSTKVTKKLSEKENFLLNRSSIIIDLINDNRSYRKMSKYIKKYHQLNISHTYIREIINKYPHIFNEKATK